MTSPAPAARTWRPRRARAVAYTMASLIMILMVVLAVILPATFHVPDRVGLIVFGLLVAGVLAAVARVHVTADAAGLTVVNPFRTHRLTWAQILDITFTPGSPWPYLDLADGRTLGMLGIQGSEGPSAHAAVEDLQSRLKTS